MSESLCCAAILSENNTRIYAFLRSQGQSAQQRSCDQHSFVVAGVLDYKSVPPAASQHVSGAYAERMNYESGASFQSLTVDS